MSFYFRTPQMLAGYTISGNRKLMNEFGFNISDLLERETAPEQKADGVDIADFLIKQDWQL